MIELTNEQILSVNQSLEDLQKSKIVLNIKASYKLARIRKVIQSFVGIIQQQQVELYQKYGEPQENNTIKVTAENIEAFTKEYEELLLISNKIEIDPISLEDFGEIEIDLQVMQGLMNVIND